MATEPTGAGPAISPQAQGPAILKSPHLATSVTAFQHHQAHGKSRKAGGKHVRPDWLSACSGCCVVRHWCGTQVKSRAEGRGEMGWKTGNSKLVAQGAFLLSHWNSSAVICV